MGERRPDGRAAREFRRFIPPARFADPGRYERDAGIFSLTPTAVIRATDEDQISSILRTSARLGLPVVARAGGSNTGGAAITDGTMLLLDGEEFSDIEIDEARGRLRCGAAVRHDQLQRAFERFGFHLPSDPSSGPFSRLGGNINTRASGPHALRHGAINRYIREIRFITAQGAIIDTRRPADVPRGIVVALSKLAGKLAADASVKARLEARRDGKWASGYELLALIDHADDPVRALPRLMTGSVGTLGIVTEAEIEGRRRDEGRAAVLLRFEHDRDACAAALVLRDDAQAVEMVSSTTLELLREHAPALCGEDDGSLLIVEYSGCDAAARAQEAVNRLPSGSGVRTRRIATSERQIAAVWRERKALLPMVRRLTGTIGVPYSVVNDVGIDVSLLPQLLEGAERIFAGHRLPAAVYGHAGSGNLHLRPFFAPADARTVAAVAEEIYALVTDLHGTITAEHGMGRLRAPFLELEWGSDIVSAMRDLKGIFDPDDILNPGVLFVPGSHRFRTDGWPTSPSLSGSG